MWPDAGQGQQPALVSGFLRMEGVSPSAALARGEVRPDRLTFPEQPAPALAIKRYREPGSGASPSTADPSPTGLNVVPKTGGFFWGGGGPETREFNIITTLTSRADPRLPAFLRRLDRLRRQRSLPRLTPFKGELRQAWASIHGFSSTHQREFGEIRPRFAAAASASARLHTYTHIHTGGLLSGSGCENTSFSLDRSPRIWAATFTWCFPRAVSDQPLPETRSCLVPPQRIGFRFLRLWPHAHLGSTKLPGVATTSTALNFQKGTIVFWGPSAASASPG